VSHAERVREQERRVLEAVDKWAQNELESDDLASENINLVFLHAETCPECKGEGTVHLELECANLPCPAGCDNGRRR
jgi:hypothetical protein